MSITIGIYEFFAYTIPGAAYLLVGLYFIWAFNLTPIQVSLLEKAWIPVMIVFAGLAYVAGLLFDPFARRWNRLFREPDLPGRVLTELQIANPDIEIKFDRTRLPLITAFLKNTEPERAEQIDRFNAINLLLRGLSLALLLLAIIQLAFSIVNPLILNFLLAFLYLGLSFLAGRQSTRFAYFYFNGIFTTLLATEFEGCDFVKLHKNPQAVNPGASQPNVPTSAEASTQPSIEQQ